MKGKVLNLGTFFVRGQHDARYFGMSYKGTKPPFESVLKELFRIVDTKRTGEWTQTKGTVSDDVKRNAYWSNKDYTIRG